MRHRLALLSLLLLGLAPAAAAQAPAYREAARIALPDGGWDLASFDPTLRRVYIARPDGVTAIDADNGKVTARLTPADGGHAVVPLNHGAEILVTDGRANTASIYDARTGARLAAVKTGEKPDAALFDRGSQLAVVMNGKSGDLTLIDPKSRAAVGQVAVGGALEMADGDGQGRLFVNVEDKNEVAVVDLKSRKVLKRIALTGCDGPTGLAYLPQARRVVSSCGNGVATVTDPASGAVEARLPIGRGPDSVLYDPTRHLALIPAGRSGELDVFADTPAGVRPLGTAATHLGARTGAVDPKTGRVYLPAADYELGVAARPQPKPGSVIALVLAP